MQLISVLLLVCLQRGAAAMRSWSVHRKREPLLASAEGELRVTCLLSKPNCPHNVCIMQGAEAKMADTGATIDSHAHQVCELILEVRGQCACTYCETELCLPGTVVSQHLQCTAIFPNCRSRVHTAYLRLCFTAHALISP